MNKKLAASIRAASAVAMFACGTAHALDWNGYLRAGPGEKGSTGESDLVLSNEGNERRSSLAKVRKFHLRNATHEQLFSTFRFRVAVGPHNPPSSVREGTNGMMRGGSTHLPFLGKVQV